MSFVFECPTEFHINSYGYIACSSGTSVAAEASQSGISQEQFNAMLGVALNESLPAPEQLVLAFGAGLAVMVPLYVVLWGIRAARESINKS